MMKAKQCKNYEADNQIGFPQNETDPNTLYTFYNFNQVYSQLKTHREQGQHAFP